jgi:hypothetical protein
LDDISRYPLSGTGGAVLIPASAVVLGKSPGPPVAPPLSGVCTLHQKPTFHPLGYFLNPALALLGQGLKKSPIGQKLDFANHPYLVNP